MEEKIAARIEKLVFTTTRPDNHLHRCAIVIASRYAITYRHGDHLRLSKGENIVLYGACKPDEEIKVSVKKIFDVYDCVLFETVNEDFPNVPLGPCSVYCGQAYIQVGVGSQRELVWKNGIISRKYNGFHVGSSHGEYGDSGSGVFDTSGRLIGLSVGKKNFTFSSSHLSAASMNYEALADHYAETKIIPVDFIYPYIGNEDHNFKPTEKVSALDKSIFFNFGPS